MNQQDRFRITVYDITEFFRITLKNERNILVEIIPKSNYFEVKLQNWIYEGPFVELYDFWGVYNYNDHTKLFEKFGIEINEFLPIDTEKVEDLFYEKLKQTTLSDKTGLKRDLFNYLTKPNRDFDIPFHRMFETSLVL